MLKIFDTTKYNINKGQSSNHYGSIGGNFGIGAAQNYRANSTIFLCLVNFQPNSKNPENAFLESQIIADMMMSYVTCH